VSQDWNHRLRAAYARSARTNRPVRLPSDETIRITGEGDQAFIDMRPRAIVANMQENGSAFEGWSLALKYWCGADVTLRWEPPVPNSDPSVAAQSERHYQRFLYRVERFKSLFNWFNIGPTDPFAGSRVLGGEAIYLNSAGAAAKERSNPTTKSLPENELENRLLNDPDFDRHYGFSQERIKDRQFPVGLFSTSVAANTSMIFPGGKGAIDLVCLDYRHLWIFELKAKSNIPIGTITELLFYSSVIRDAVMAKFKFGETVGNRARVKPEMLADVDTITAVMLGHDLHPLLSDPGLLKLLNQAVARHWNTVVRAPKLMFRVGQIMQDVPLKICERG